MFEKNIADLRKAVRTKAFWISTILALIVAILAVYGQQNPEHQYLSAPFVLLFLIMIPAIGAEGISVRFGYFFAKIFRWTMNFINREKIITYTILPEYERQTSVKKFTILNTIYCFGFAFFLMRLFSIGNENMSDQTFIVLLMLNVFLSLMIGSGFTISFLLIKRIGFMMNDSKDGSRVNFGSKIEGLLLAVFAPLQILFFLSGLISETNYIQFFATLFVLGIACVSSSFFSFYVIKLRHEKRLTNNLREQLKKLIN